MRIVVLDGYGLNPGDLSWEALSALGELVVYDRTAPEDVVLRAKDAEGVLINKVIINADIISQLPRLRYIGVLATGYNVVDTAEAHRRHIIVTNIPAYSTESVVQMVFAHLLNITNRVGHYAAQNRNMCWSRNPDFCYWDTPLLELSGKTIGIVGLGNIGSRVAELAHAFRMNVLALTSKPQSSLPGYVRSTELHELLSMSDIVTLHCPLTDSTHHIINRQALSLMKKGSVLINTGRGPLVDEQYVADALQSGQLGAYGADVLCDEPPTENNPLLHAPNAYITPHIAWATFEARTRLMDIAVDNVRAFQCGKPVNVVS